jgi:hypothetical protein
LMRGAEIDGADNDRSGLGWEEGVVKRRAPACGTASS